MPSSRFDVQLTRKAEKDLGKLKHDEERAAREIRKLADDPLLGHSLKGALSGARSLEFTLRGGGAFRAVYIVHENTVCIVFIVGPHENIYKKAESRFAALKRSLG
ncbi:MAG: type II toxin-antitoxin system RelE/ParE family toxin [Gemmatimonadetes bacterium]|jgi:mRNA-degrading endonuclease RelE of RelBE toxin-antitoxin system|nr:type II toxin-antitoxin system RelE/ParE family toxin [Gemmatimonadota bacterium]